MANRSIPAGCPNSETAWSAYEAAEKDRQRQTIMDAAEKAGLDYARNSGHVDLGDFEREALAAAMEYGQDIAERTNLDIGGADIADAFMEGYWGCIMESHDDEPWYPDDD